ncbi:MAG: T9SS type A sorting domain-containing protein [Saprospiraceae bacterium]
MIRFLFIGSFFLTVLNTMKAQNVILDKKRDYQWPFGYYFYQNGNLMDFNTKPVQIRDFPKRLKEDFFEYNSAICGTDGQLEFFTNGCDVYNRKFEIMKNGQKINPGVYTEAFFCRNGGSMRIRDGSLILPYQNKYLMLHTTFDLEVTDPNARLYVSRLNYSIIDMKKDMGFGEVIVKNKTIIQDTLSAGDIAACRHTNGKDWWVIVPQWTWSTSDSTDNNKYYRLLVKEDTILGPWEQQIGIRPNKRYYSEQVCFSADGKKYARLRSKDGLLLFDFDRSTGLFSNPKVVDFGRGVYRGGVCFSPNSQYLYASMDSLIYQIDMQAADPNQAKEVVAEYDGFAVDGIWRSTFDGAYLGPDCKIYIVPAATIEYLTVINYPNRKSKACGVEQHGLKVPTKVSWSVPNYPHFRLGAIDEPHTPCDSSISPYISAVGSVEEVPVTVALYPNPATEHVNMDLFGYVNRFEKGRWELFDLSGRAILHFPVYQGHDQYDFDISAVPPGIYVWRLSFEGRPGIKSGKLLVTPR